jgi:hypothetical protein
MCLTSDGGCFILCGNTKANWPYTSISWNSLLKVNAAGDSVWSVPLTDSSDVWVNAPLTDMIATSEGGCLVAGGGYGWNDGKHALVMKINSDGTFAWSSTSFPAVDDDRFKCLCLSSDGGYFAAGTEGFRDARLLVSKINGSGSTLWSKTFYSGNFSTGDEIMAEAYSVAPTSDGGCLITGYVTDPASYVSAALLIRINSSGDSLWTKKYFHPDAGVNDQATGYKLLKLSGSQYLFFLHRHSSTAAGATLLKLNDSGDSLWSQVGYEYTLSMNSTDADGGILFTGWAGGEAQNIGVFIKATSGGVYRTPILQGPGSNSDGVDIHPTLLWSGQPHYISSAHMQISSDTAFSAIVVDTTVNIDTVRISKSLAANTKYFWRVQTYGPEGGPSNWSDVWNFTTGNIVSVKRDINNIPTEFSLEQNYPNPFNPATTINYSVPKTCFVSLIAYDILGNEVAILVNGIKEPGKYSAKFSATSCKLTSGIYFYRLRAGSFAETKKLIILK